MMNVVLLRPRSVQTNSIEQRLISKATTHLAKIAIVLQRAPCKMLTFSQLMSKLAPSFAEDPKYMESNIRVCLSSYRCFVKIPVVPGSHNTKKNYWQLDTHQITEKMVRRHFKGILELFPELASKVDMEHMIREPMHAPAPGPVVKFSGPFSIESLLMSDGVPSEMPTAQPLPRMVLREQQQPLPQHQLPPPPLQQQPPPPPLQQPPLPLQQPRNSHTRQRMNFSCWGTEELLVPASSSGMSFVCSSECGTCCGFTAARAEEPIRHKYTTAPFPFHSIARPAPYFTSSYNHYINYPEPRPTYEAHQIWM